MTREEMKKVLKDMGLNKQYKPIQDPNSENDIISLKTRKEPQFKDGFMTGVEAIVLDSQTFKVWTNQRAKAKRYARDNQLKVRLFDGEAEIFIPSFLADTLLPKFGVRIKRTRILTPEQLEVLRERMRKARESKSVPTTP